MQRKGVRNEWLYDEVDLVPTAGGTEFCHSILFTNGVELRLRFIDFDFATLKPLATENEPAPVTPLPWVTKR